MAPGETSGNATRSERQVPAPSSAAASQKSSGMAAQEFWTTNVANGNGNVITGTTPINELVNNALSIPR